MPQSPRSRRGAQAIVAGAGGCESSIDNSRHRNRHSQRPAKPFPRSPPREASAPPPTRAAAVHVPSARSS
eukprot:4032496-Prymnesium_polylepis.1